MAIYSRQGSRVQFKTARLVPVWTTLGNIGNGVELKWHYAEPKRTSKWRKDVEIGFFKAWHVTAAYADDGKDFGREIDLSWFVADDGIAEIVRECQRLNPADAEQERLDFAA